MQSGSNFKCRKFGYVIFVDFFSCLKLYRLHNEVGFSLPEMTFGENYLRLVHNSSTFCYEFLPNAALVKCKFEEGDEKKLLKVSMADSWGGVAYVCVFLFTLLNTNPGPLCAHGVAISKRLMTLSIGHLATSIKEVYQEVVQLW